MISYICSMKTQILSTFIAVIAVSSAHAQSFNTISNSRPRYKVEQSHTDIKKEAPLESDTSNINVPEQEVQTPIVNTKEKEQIKYPLSVSYPLRQPKLHVSSPYGWRIHPVTGKHKFHAGIDLRANYEPVYSMLPGKVLSVGYESKGGNFISLQHGTIKVTYCHLSVIGVKKGDAVYAGQPIGVSGNSGQYTTGPHLHLGVKELQSGRSFSASTLLKFIAAHI